MAIFDPHAAPGAAGALPQASCDAHAVWLRAIAPGGPGAQSAELERQLAADRVLKVMRTTQPGVVIGAPQPKPAS